MGFLKKTKSFISERRSSTYRPQPMPTLDETPSQVSQVNQIPSQVLSRIVKPPPPTHLLTAEDLRDLSEMIRRRYALDVEIWARREAKEFMRDRIKEKMVQSDATLVLIRQTLQDWDRPDFFADANDYAKFCDIKNRLMSGDKVIWRQTPPWEHSKYHMYALRPPYEIEGQGRHLPVAGQPYDRQRLTNNTRRPPVISDGIGHRAPVRDRSPLVSPQRPGRSFRDRVSRSDPVVTQDHNRAQYLRQQQPILSRGSTHSMPPSSTSTQSPQMLHAEPQRPYVESYLQQQPPLSSLGQHEMPGRAEYVQNIPRYHGDNHQHPQDFSQTPRNWQQQPTMYEPYTPQYRNMQPNAPPESSISSLSLQSQRTFASQQNQNIPDFPSHDWTPSLRSVPPQLDMETQRIIHGLSDAWVRHQTRPEVRSPQEEHQDLPQFLRVGRERPPQEQMRQETPLVPPYNQYNPPPRHATNDIMASPVQLPVHILPARTRRPGQRSASDQSPVRSPPDNPSRRAS